MYSRKRKKQIKAIKYKVVIILGLMFLVVLGGLGISIYKYFYKQSNYYKVDSRVEQLKEEKPIDGSGYKSIAWLKVQGTDIDVPIVYSEDEDEDFPVQLENFGWTLNSINENSTYYRIIGHNIFNLSASPKLKSKNFHRLEQLMSFVYYDFAKDNEYIQLTVGDKDYVFKIFAVMFVDVSDSHYLYLNDNPKDYELEFVNSLIKKNNLYKYDVDVNENDKLISLSTCTRLYGTTRNTGFYVFGRQLRDGEKKEHYKVTKTDKYKEVEKILKGDEVNE